MIHETPKPANDEIIREFADYKLKPRHKCRKDGVYYIGVNTDREGNIGEADPLLLSEQIEIIGTGKDNGGAHYRIIRWRDEITHCSKAAALPMGEIGTAQGWARLQSQGITIASGRRKRELLADYLMAKSSNTGYTVTGRAGWHGRNAYILPGGEVITAGKKNVHTVIYNGDTSQASAYTPCGTLEQWQAEIARYAAGNSRLILAIGTALAAPLLGLLGTESGGFHLFGDSRDGKSTAARLALSVWGNPAELMLSWTGTSHGFSNTANARNDGFLVLDEIGQANPRHVSQTAYSVINGIAKIQGAKEGGNRETNRWRVLLFSTGEKPLDAFIRKNGGDWNAGQAARLPSIPSDAGQGLGIFDTLHGHSAAGHLAETVKQAADNYHGTAGRAFISLLLNKPTALDEARTLQADFMETLPELNGQARTVALRFALAAAALELAARHGITGLKAGLAFPAVKQCFDAWLQRAGSGKYEDQAIMENALDFAQRHFESQRFVILPAPPTFPNPHEFAGYRRKADSAEQDSFYILPSVFEQEICKDFDKEKVCKVLSAANWLQYNQADKRWQHKVFNKGRFYLMKGILPPSELSEK